MPFWLSFWHPAIVAYFVLAFDVYWFYKSFNMAYNGTRAFLTISAHAKVDWLKLVKEFSGWEKIHHVLIIPEYKEPLPVLEETFNNLLNQEYPLKKLVVVLATEAIDPRADEISALLKKKYAKYFKHFWITRHPQIPGEVTGKSSNMAWAGRETARKLESLGFDLTLTTVTSCDADVLLHPKYYSYLTHLFLTDDKRQYHFYQPAILFYSNIWRVPFPSRVVNTISSILNLSNLPQEDRLINFSTYSLTFSTVKKVGFWGVDVIPEDYHLFFKTYFALGEEVRTKPIFLPVMADAAESRGFLRTMVNQYEQHKRWAWGVSDLPFVIRNYFTNSTIPFWNKTLRVWHVLENHLLWPTNWFILTLGSTIPPIVNNQFARTVLGHNLAQLSSAILTFSIGFLLVMIFLDLRSKPERPKDFKTWKIPVLYIQWLSLPIVSFFLSALPGLDAHTRLMLGKRLEYRVTEKV
ncbi:glycosyltransferase family 2 protein [Candidatus Gottesmanbacteria bacterium]|nr:glycosyltransferase family 2 protein [Candidatus Gottesmanbacteria bacterium]